MTAQSGFTPFPFATPGSPMAYVFNYMGPNPAHAKVIKKVWPDGGADGQVSA